jgi:NAD(P)-dependent dehydrogenase (short-subunit alcohol dehydrogenase family)
MYSKAATTGQLQWMWASVSVHSAALNKLDQTKPITTWAIKKLAQWLRISGGSRSGRLICQLYQAQAAVAIWRLQDSAAGGAGSQPGERLGGQLLFNVSKQALNPGPNFGAYGLSKAALLALVRQYALEEGENGIRVNAINADRIRSGLLDGTMIRERAAARGVSEDVYMAGNLLGQEVLASDVADAFVALARLQRSTGALLTVDGGNVAAMVR